METANILTKVHRQPSEGSGTNLNEVQYRGLHLNWITWRHYLTHWRDSMSYLWSTVCGVESSLYTSLISLGFDPFHWVSCTQAISSLLLSNISASSRLFPFMVPTFTDNIRNLVFARFFGHIRNLCDSPCRFPTAVRRLCWPSRTGDDLTVLETIAVSFIMICVAKFYCRLAPDANITFLGDVPSDHVTEGCSTTSICLNNKLVCAL